MMNRRSVLVTGGNRGIGYAIVAELLGRGDHVIMTSRDRGRGEQARSRLLSEHPGAQLEVRSCDFSSPESVQDLTSALVAERCGLDAVINNAGMLQSPPVRGLTPEGVEVTLATNALGPLALVEGVASQLAPEARVVSLTSRLHLPGSRGEPVGFDFADPNLDFGYHPDRAYKNSKLALLWVSSVLDRQLGASVTSNAVCPGFAPETAARYADGWMRLKLRWIVPRLPFAVSVTQAASNVLWALDAPTLTARGGLYLADREVAEASAEARDDQLADRFVELAHARWPRIGEW